MTYPPADPASPRAHRSTNVEALFAQSSFGAASLAAFEITSSHQDNTSLDPTVALEAEFEAEAALIAAASPLRRRHFLAGRACAHSALAALGVEHSGIGRHESRAPLWPPDVIGAITHTDGYATAVVATDATSSFGIGIDAEQIGRVDAAVAKRVMNAAERIAVANHATPEIAATALFCAKESFYKAQWPHTQSWVGFEDVTVSFDADSTLVLHRATARTALDGFLWPIVARFAVIGDVAVGGLVASRLR